MTKLTLTRRQAKDIQLALYYVEQLKAHGSANHNWMTLVAHLADYIGILLDFYAEGITLVRSPIDKRPILADELEIVDD